MINYFTYKGIRHKIMISPKASLSILELADTELSAISDEAWLINRNEDASKKIFVATENLVFGFKLFIGVQFKKNSKSQNAVYPFFCLPRL